MPSRRTAPSDLELGFSKRTFAFLRELEANNERAWFQEHKDHYATDVQAPFAFMLARVSDALAGSAVPWRGSSATMFRINRDVRFSKDKRPYKTNASGMLTPDGRKRVDGPVIYVQLDARGGFIGAGVYRLAPASLAPIRAAIVDEDGPFDDVVAALKRAKLALEDADALATMPRGFAAHADHPHAAYLKLKSFLVTRKLTQKAWLANTVVDDIATFARAAAPLLAFLQDANDG